MTTIIYAAPFEPSQLVQLSLDTSEYDEVFRPSLKMLQPKDNNGQARPLTSQELERFSETLAHRQFKQIGQSGLYRHPIISDLCCIVMRREGETTLVPGNNVILIEGAAFQWTFFQRGQTSAQDRVRVINGGIESAHLSTPVWVAQPEADKFFSDRLHKVGENVDFLNLKRGGTRIPVLPPSAYRPG